MQSIIVFIISMSTDLEEFNKIIDKFRRNLNMGLSDMLEASPVVIAAIERHTDNANVVKDALYALHRIANQGRDAKKALLNANVLPVIVAAMNAHISNAEVVENGCKALFKIIFMSDDTNKQAAINANVLEVTVKSMRTHSDVTEILKDGCFIIFTIVSVPAGKQAAVDVGAVAAIVAAMREHPEIAEVREWGCRALFKIAHNFELGRKAVHDENILKLVSDIMNDPNTKESTVDTVKDLLADVYSNGSECGICLININEAVPSATVQGATILKCGHMFHTHCIREWYMATPESNHLCPVCRQRFHARNLTLNFNRSGSSAGGSKRRKSRRRNKSRRSVRATKYRRGG